jgi:hypothetical protein
MPPLNCRSCHTSIREKQHRLVCTKCEDAFHRTCQSKIYPKDFHRLKKDWKCDPCSTPTEANVDLFAHLPFLDDGNLVDDVKDDTKESKRQRPPTSSDTAPIAAPQLQKGLRLRHLNINSIRNKIDELRIFLMQYSFDVCGITETKLQQDDDSTRFNIQGYQQQLVVPSTC